ncbi:MAG: CPBP family intramembrane metalloprotease [Phycisphaerae bacterium]|nr:CPBP family intramembrane metalloprotease [Phycisphaerae bacterium]
MQKRNAILSLVFLLPAPSLAVWAGMIVWPDTVFGKAVFALCKVWILALPAIWFFGVERQRLLMRRPGIVGIVVGALLGLVISAMIFLGYWCLARNWIDPAVVKNLVAKVGLGRPVVYLVGAAYWVIVNALLEEYVWRWFVFRQFRTLMPAFAAVAASATGFTLHHIVAMQTYFPPHVVTIAALGIFIGGVIWSWCYWRFGTIWPGYLSHAIVDVAVFSIGYCILFR